ncbi:M20/M25/M40 family metallo-hydrolase [Sphingomonas sp. BN140010]|uniref:M20/M25/M40 family metallo-hydrolase n=1 Tax=Sphingomonas arvum TaxID=2992113 RepID=A0ABT3JGP0_9SPHN|nr:M20/M25/M40 family metallo-hydrolase [Sphingomonas sp. BN140010]MCW3798109.1 M20/M25/M40 family metallo-hydrolase [Sphingomonas sp. BN140010]
MIGRLLALAVAAFLASPATAALTPAEQRMAATVQAENDRTLGLLERMVNQNSGTLNLAGVEAVGRMIRAELEPLGFQVRWIPLRETGRAGHLVATHKGRAGTKRLLLIGHLDTVFEPDSPFQRFVREGNKGHGPGASDDKGGVAVMIAALRAMQAAGTLRGANVTVFLTGDEEDAGSPQAIARRDLIAAGKAADVALDFEGLVRENGQDMGSVARRSAQDWVLTVRARSAHSSGVGGGSGYGAIYELTRILDTFRRELPEPNLTYNVGLAGGGTTAAFDAGKARVEATGKPNIIAPVAVARGDLRALSAEQIARVQAKMQSIVAQNRLAGVTGAELVFEEGYPPMAPTAGNRAILDRLNRVNADLGLRAMPALDPIKRGAGDISFVAADVDGLIGLGPASSGDHTAEERVDLPTIPLQATRAAILMSRLARERR